MKRDIENRDDVELLVNTFYQQVVEDNVIGYIFVDVAKIKLAEHLNIMYTFWDAILFQHGGYKGNTVRKHLDLNAVEPLLDRHFDRWLTLWTSTIDELFVGQLAEEAKRRAVLMRHLIQYKINAQNKPGFIQ